MWAAIASRVISATIITQAWFFTNDDWDFVTREGIGQSFEPHQGHLNVFNTVIAVGLRSVVGLDYWPGYGLVIALAWPVVALAAWWLWRRRGVHPLIASGGAVLLTWFGSASYMQFSQVNPAWAIAASLIAMEFDQREISTRNTGLGLLFSLAAVFANTIGAMVAAVRLVVAAIRREWNGAIIAGTSFVAFLIVRTITTEVPQTSIGIGDIPTFFRAIFQILGWGVRHVIPYPSGFEGMAGFLLVAVAVTIVAVRRFEYLTTAAIVGAGAWLAAAAVTKVLNLWEPAQLEGLITGRSINQVTLYMRFANVVMAFTLVAFIAGRPAIWLPRKLDDRIRPHLPAIGAALLVGLVAFSIGQTFGKWDRTADRSAIRAEIVGGLTAVSVADEPQLAGSRGRQVNASIGAFRLRRTLHLESGAVVTDEALRVALQRGELNWLAEQGHAASILRSDVFEVQGLEPDMDWARALVRFDFEEDGRYLGSWADLGLEHRKCIALAELDPMQIAGTTRFQIGWDPSLPTPRRPKTSQDIDEVSVDMILLRLDDDFGRSEIGLSMDRDRTDSEPLLWVEVLGPEGGAGTITLTVAGPSDAVMCHKGAG